MRSTVKKGKVNLIDWFNPDDEEHLLAWCHLQETGSWPDGFLPENVEININWIFSIYAKMADRWVVHIIG